ncbi:ROK family transcriptional regulator [Anaerotignum lactatifermentans]|uniref:ROK family transcriptional regulator n=1 Tax=Anaerotignum lactatifermentans TaxID=160404 RepID=A0ABS2G9M3_9FIRM|nr:ROK family transcriptional regulator [Anaerotignum lactatifermentans]MBM6828443.1 ROK family transcriptional regulator [Anaerotignum lactatifermentans]MBM6877850.1 ROK family transcriptional regulator [Anaerotignum lactatifermentans]MBM6950026.1 ROK family transcriptional regulator [Anaerotignum lactatifermentans]
MTPKKISTAQLRKQNRNQVFRAVYDAENPMTKQEIAQKLHLSLPTVTQNLKELFDECLLAYAGTDASTGGRKARLIALDENAYFSVGIELSPKHIRYIAINLKAKELAYERVEHAFTNTSEYRIFYAEKLEEFLNKFHLSRERLLGVGITLPGIVSEQKEIVEIAPVLHIRRMKLSLFTENIPYPTFVQNDASAGGVAEWWNYDGPSAMAYLFVGKGVGGALMMDGKSFEGQNRHSGEFGHMCIVPNGRPCNCGRRGCLEAYCSTSCITDDLGLSPEEFFTALARNDPKVTAIWEEYSDYLVTAIHNIHMVMDCDIVLGGSLTPYFQSQLPYLRKKLRERSFFPDEEDFLFLGKCEGKANCVGVALHFIAGFLESI